MPNPFKETNWFEPVNGSDSVYGRIMQNPYPVGTDPDPSETLQLDMAELEMEDPLSSEYPYYDEPLGMCGVGGFFAENH